jgi:gamma-glutamylcyclotransferase (GGCT)/AIG2-like uncharacterized protein YtfP
MAQPTDCLFVYGTLMPGSRHPMAGRLGGESRIVGPGSVPGRLYDLGAYPGAVAVAAPAERVHGVVLRLANPARSLRWLDAYEGAGEDDREPGAYERVIVRVRLTVGRQVDAWIYYFRGALGRAKYLRGGRYGARKALSCLRS